MTNIYHKYIYPVETFLLLHPLLSELHLVQNRVLSPGPQSIYPTHHHHPTLLYFIHPTLVYHASSYTLLYHTILYCIYPTLPYSTFSAHLYQTLHTLPTLPDSQKGRRQKTNIAANTLIYTILATNILIYQLTH